MKLSKNFSYKELTFSREAHKNGIENIPSTDELVSMTSLCQRILQPIRDAHGAIFISSGFRSETLAPLVGSTIKSQHCRGEAADFESYNIPNDKMCLWITENLDEWDDLILEHFNEKDPNSGWIHVSYRRAGNNRKQVRRATRRGKKVHYELWDPKK